MKNFKKMAVLLAGLCLLCFVHMPIIVKAAEDIELNDSGSGFVKTYDPGEGSSYKYMGYVYCFEAASEYKYLQITYTGDETAFDELRLEFVVNSDPSEEIKLTPCWFRENEEGTMLTVEGTEAPNPSAEEQTVVFDLEKSGLDLSTGIRAFHVHDTQGKGSFTITDARLMTSPTGSVDTPAEQEKETQKDLETQEAASSEKNTDENATTEDPSNILLIGGIILGGCVVAVVAALISKKMNFDK